MTAEMRCHRCSPDVTRTCIASRFAPGELRASPVVDGHLEVVTIGQTKTCGRDRAETRNVARYPRLTAPRSAAVAAGPVEQVPGTGARIRPADAHATTTRPRGNGREAVFDALRGERDILACRVAGAVIARFHEGDALRGVISLIDRRIVEEVDTIIAANHHRHLSTQEGEAAARTGIGRPAHADRRQGPGPSPIARLGHDQVDRPLRLSVLCVAPPGQFTDLLRINAGARSSQHPLLRT